MFGGNVTVASLVLANVAISLLIWLAMGLSALTGMPDTWVLRVFALPAGIGQFLTMPWTLVTYMFAQANPLQLLFNMLWLVWFGRWLSDSDGPKAVLRLYLLGGITGGIFYLMAANAGAGGSFLMGSSAATLAVMVYAAIRRPDMDVPLFLIGEVRLKWIAVFTVILTLLGASGVAAHCAHIGGALSPLLLILYDKVKTSVRGRQPRRRKPKAFKNMAPRQAAERIDEGDRKPEEVLDELLNKVRVSGFDSLTEREKQTLNEVSAALNNNSNSL